jgi:hypothetical protein
MPSDGSNPGLGLEEAAAWATAIIADGRKWLN